MRESIKDYIKTALSGLAVCVMIIFYESHYFGHDIVNVMRMISDGAFVAGVLLVGVGAMAVIASAGLFDAFTFLANSIVWTFSPRKGAFEKRMKYFDYKLEKEKKRANGEKSYRYIVVTGVIFLLLSLVVAVL